jgi:hypothetical protein
MDLFHPHPAKFEILYMEYISTEDSDKYDIKHGRLTESPLRGSTAGYICNPIVDDIEASRNLNEEYQPPDCEVIGDPSVNNLATHRWRNDGLPNAKIEADLIRPIQGGVGTRPAKSNPARDDERAFRKLLEAFHRTVVGPAGKHIPGGTFSRRRPKGLKHTNDLLYEDLTSVGCESLWQSALKFDPDGGHRFNTLSRHKIVGAIRNEANYLRQQGVHFW